ncbi:collagen alpha-1(XII) chain-like [Haliotis rubra]|uniref:collagen alpha-1(XII) chain-like n=1 Tax=Haliotis rubra TaxID=36100 RepID=UPI001EE5E6FC|nr:collagen alpha-1(XII) chain-like [Haliotis rubra]
MTMKLNLTFCVSECTPIIQDVIIIEDVSISIGPHNYEKTKAFVVDTIRNISKSSKETNVAFMVFSDTAEVLFHLNTYRDKKTSIMEAIDSKTHTGGNTFLGDAIKLATSEVFTEINGDRSNVPNVVLLLTDGNSDANEDVRSSIDGLKAKAEVFVVTVTDQVDNTTIDLVASFPALNHVFHIDTAETASSIKDVTSGHICPKPVSHY